MDGVLIIHKPSGWTSHDVVQKTRNILKEKRIGHTGTLDPRATGVLVLCLGKGTRIARYLESDDKEYHGVMRLGEITDTQDADGKVIEKRSYAPPSREDILRVMERFMGPILQRPPAYSAKKVSGVPSYRLARKGQATPLEPQTVTIAKLELMDYDDPLVRFSVTCSKGTYVRTLCADMGDALGTGGHLAELERVRSGRFRREDAVTLDELARLAAGGRVEDRVISLDEALSQFVSVTVEARDADRIRHGNAVLLPPRDRQGAGMPLRVHDADGRLLAIARGEDNRLKPEVVF